MTWVSKKIFVPIKSTFKSLQTIESENYKAKNEFPSRKWENLIRNAFNF